MKIPCHGCDKRTPVCHVPGNCANKPTYHEWKASVEAAKGGQDHATDFLIRNIERNRKRNRTN